MASFRLCGWRRHKVIVPAYIASSVRVAARRTLHVQGAGQAGVHSDTHGPAAPSTDHDADTWGSPPRRASRDLGTNFTHIAHSSRKRWTGEETEVCDELVATSWPFRKAMRDRGLLFPTEGGTTLVLVSVWQHQCRAGCQVM